MLDIRILCVRSRLSQKNAFVEVDDSFGASAYQQFNGDGEQTTLAIDTAWQSPRAGVDLAV